MILFLYCLQVIPIKFSSINNNDQLKCSVTTYGDDTREVHQHHPLYARTLD